MGDVINKARRDTLRFIQSGGNVDITFTTPDGMTSTTIKGIAAKINKLIELEDNRFADGNHSHVTVSESLLTDAAYPVRAATGDQDVAMIGHRVTWTDSAGRILNHEVQRIEEDETVGVIKFIVGRSD